jgi:hypothetical protein
MGIKILRCFPLHQRCSESLKFWNYLPTHPGRRTTWQQHRLARSERRTNSFQSGIFKEKLSSTALGSEPPASVHAFEAVKCAS